MWRLAQIRTKIDDPIPWDASWGPDAPAPAVSMLYCVSCRSNYELRVHQKTVAGCGNTMAPMKRHLLNESWLRNPSAPTRES
jgi:hypothetical protein